MRYSRPENVSVQANFSRFLENIELDTGRVERIRSAAQRLDDFSRSDPGIRQYAPHVFFQGSFAAGTAVKPVYPRQEYDVDIVVLMSLPRSAADSVLDWFAGRLRQDADYRARLMSPKDKCVRLNYAGDFHVDTVPAHRVTDNNERLQIPSRRSRWLYSHPKGYIAWCKAQEQRTRGDFGRCVKMMKRWRDVTGGAREAVSSIVIATLLGRHITTATSTIPDALVVVQTCRSLNQYLQAAPRKPVIRNPSMQSEDLALGWSQAAYDSFRQHIGLATQIAGQACRASSDYEAARLWRGLFGDDFPLSA
jgi:hypothetical protein